MKQNNGFSYGTFITGVTVGAALTMLFAPQTGEETRELIAEKAEEGKEYLSSKARGLRSQVKNVTAKVQDTVYDAKEQIQDAVSAGKDAYDQQKFKMEAGIR
jgi:gas vesicle protein